jgi:hypothetical protein
LHGGGFVGDEDVVGSLIRRVLELARNQLLLDVAWLAELVGDRLVVRVFTGDASPFGLYDGWSCASGSAAVAAIANGFCRRRQRFPDADERGRASECCGVARRRQTVWRVVLRGT